MSGTTINLFTLHSRNWQTNRYVYPVISRRSKGLSIGVNLNPDKVCNFDCNLLLRGPNRAADVSRRGHGRPPR